MTSGLLGSSEGGRTLGEFKFGQQYCPITDTQSYLRSKALREQELASIAGGLLYKYEGEVKKSNGVLSLLKKTHQPYVTLHTKLQTDQ